MARTNRNELTDPSGGAVHYTLWSALRIEPGWLGNDRALAVRQARTFMGLLARRSVESHGVYDLAGLRADADYMVWWHAPRLEDLQSAFADLRNSTLLGRVSVPIWSQVGVHRPAESDVRHVPECVAAEPRRFVCVSPLIRSRDWHLLPTAERRRMLAEHDRAARDFPDVRTHTVPAFALGDYEWILVFEADELHRIVELMRHLRGLQSRLYVRGEVPFSTGRRVEVGEIVARAA